MEQFRIQDGGVTDAEHTDLALMLHGSIAPLSQVRPSAPKMRSVVIVKELRIHVGPEFLDHVGESIEPHLRDPALASLGPGALGSGIVEVCNPSRRTIAHDFGEIE